MRIAGTVISSIISIVSIVNWKMSSVFISVIIPVIQSEVIIRGITYFTAIIHFVPSFTFSEFLLIPSTSLSTPYIHPMIIISSNAFSSSANWLRNPSYNPIMALPALVV